jgi:SoxA/TsdA, cytochrome c domain
MRATFLIGVAALVIGVTAAAGRAEDGGRKRPQHVVPKAQHGGTVVGLCDGETTTEVKVAPGTALPRPEAQKVSDELMAEWRRKHPEVRWDEAVAQNAQPTSVPPQPPNAQPRNAPPPSGANVSPGVPRQKTTATKAPAGTRPKDQGGVYGDYSARDELVWKMETEKFVAEGNAIFHDPKKLGGTVGISCDMCHPNGSNTHPETYPKYQVQLQRVALLRDMINWCLENPVKAQALPDDSVKMRALEAYIISQRKGQKLDFGKH